MKKVLICMMLVAAAAVSSRAQTPQASPTPTVQGAATTVQDGNITDKKIEELPKVNMPVVPDHPGTASSTYVRPDAKTRTKRYINSVVGPFALARTVATAGISTWQNSPEEWGDHWEGFGRRVASNFGRNVIKQTTTFALDEALKYDSHYYRSKDKSVGGRVRNAFLSPVTARDRNGKRVVGIPRIAGTLTASIAARALWYPAGYDWKDGLKSAPVSIGFNVAYNLFKEFVWKK
jgi:hypothetical protein